MWTYEYINKNYLEDCVMQTLLIYKDDVVRSKEFVKMSSDDDMLFEEFANEYLQFIQSLG
jgi:hypothetical protein